MSPQATDELRAKFPDDAQEAFAVIDTNFLTTRDGIIYPKIVGYQTTERESDAIDYLCDEWDYVYWRALV